MQRDPITSRFNGISEHELGRLIEGYALAVQFDDLAWLEKNVEDNRKLTPDNRRLLASLSLGEDETPFLVHAAATRKHGLISFLLGEDAAHKEEALATAVGERDSSAVKLLCDAGVDANTRIQLVPCLNLAVATFDTASARHLLEARQKANINNWRNDDMACTALFDSIGAYEQRVRYAIDEVPFEEIARMPRKEELATLGLLLQFQANALQRGAASSLTAYEFAEMFAPADPRPLELIKEWQPETAAQAETLKLMQRMRLGPK